MSDQNFSPLSSNSAPQASSGSAVHGKRRRKSSKKSTVVIGSIIGVVVLIGAVLGGLFFTGVIGGNANDYSGSGHGEVNFTINEGEIGDQIANNLVEAGVTKSFDSFYQLLLETKPEPVFTPGVYRLKLEMSAKAALAALQDPANRVELSATIPEGTTEKNVLKILAE